jgi:hypothetical protein
VTRRSGLSRPRPRHARKAAQATVAKDQQARQRIAQGEYLFDMLKLGDVLKSLGVTEQ